MKVWTDNNRLLIYYEGESIKQEIHGKRCHTCRDKVIQVPICIEKNLFCSIQEIDRLVCKKNGQSRKFGILAC